MDHAPQPASARDVISDPTVVQPRRRLPSTLRHAAAADLANAAAAVANYRFTVGPDEAFPLPPSPLVKPKNSSSGRSLSTSTNLNPGQNPLDTISHGQIAPKSTQGVAPVR